MNKSIIIRYQLYVLHTQYNRSGIVDRYLRFSGVSAVSVYNHNSTCSHLWLTINVNNSIIFNGKMHVKKSREPMA